jgi:hypothetical protein
MSPLNSPPSPPVASQGERDAEIGSVRAARVRMAGWGLALAMGFIQTWRSRHAMNPDGVSYLDVAEAYLAADWSAAINATWSPLFSWLIAAATALIRPSSYWEFTVVHLVNFVVYALSLLTFEFLLTELLRARRGDNAPRGRHSSGSSDEWAWRLLGYSLFVWSALAMINLTLVTPDMCVAALTYLAAGILLRLRNPSVRWWLPVGLGVTLGVGYLAKAAMFPLAFVFLGVGLVAWRVPRSIAVRRVVVAVAGFVAVAGPYVVVLSIAKGYPTWGAVSKLVYAWCVDNAPRSPPCGAASAERHFLHATRQISDAPAVFEFATPVAGTYPPWYDPSRWYEGVTPRVSPRRMLGRLLVHSLEYLRILAPMVAVFGVLWWASGRSVGSANSVRAFATLTVPSVVALLMYGMIYIETRYLGPFMVLLTLGAFAGLHPPEARNGEWLLGGAAVSLAAVLAAPLVVALLLNAVVLASRPELTGRGAHTQWQVAEALRRTGLDRGDQVAVIGEEVAPYWARLAGLKVVAQIPTWDEADRFWAADSATRTRVTRLLATAGAEAVVAGGMPTWAPREGWRPLGTTGYQVLVVDDQPERREGLRESR